MRFLMTCGVVLSFLVVPTSAIAHADIFDVTAYGADGSDSADDSSAIQAAINAAQSSSRGGIVYVPPGRYRLSSSLVVTGNNIQIQGAGMASQFLATSSSTEIVRIGNSSNLDLTMHNTVRDLSFDRSLSPTSQSMAIRVTRARFTRIENVRISNAGVGIGVGIAGASDISTQWVNISNSWIQGGTFPDAGLRFYSGADYWVSTTHIEPSNRGIVLSGNTNGVFIKDTSVINGGNYNYGLVIEGSNFAVHVDHCNIENALHQQILIGSSVHNVTITDSWIGAGNEVGVTRVGVQIEPNAHSITLANNRIGDQRQAGIMSKGSLVIIKGNRFEHNVNTGSAADSIQIEGGSRTQIEGNIVRSWADRCSIGVRNSTRVIVKNNDVTSSPGSGVCQSWNSSMVVSDNI